MCLSIAVLHPDHVLAAGTHMGYDWCVVHNGMGFRCGYIRVGKDHPWFGKDYHQIEACVHCGLTFSEADIPCAKGGADDGWWVGFDCAHGCDAQDPDLPFDPMLCLPKAERAVVRTQEYVENQCRLLAEQADVDAKLS